MSLRLFTLCFLVATAAAGAGDNFDLIGVSGDRSAGGVTGLATLHPTNGAFGSLRFSFINASISRDGTRIAYRQTRELHVANLDGTDDQVISTSPGEQIRWSPSGDRLGVREGRAIRIVSLTGTILQTLQDTNHISHFDWSPNGLEIVYSVVDGVRVDIPNPPAGGMKFVFGAIGQLKIVTLASGATRVVYESPKPSVTWIDSRWALFSSEGVSPAGFRWSPRGDTLVVGHFISKQAFPVVNRPATLMPEGVEDEQHSLAIFDLGSGAIRHLVVSHWSDINAGSPAWSRDGSQIVYRAGGTRASSEDGIYIIPETFSPGELPPLGSHSPLGHRVAGAADFPGGRNALPLDWVIPNPEIISFTAPAPDEIVPRGKPYTIRFTAHPTIAAVDLYLVRTRNPDGPRELLARGVPAAGGQHVWEVPEEMETPSTFIVAVDSNNPAREGTSQRFRVRQRWRLHRIVGTFNELKYERISTTDHSWSFDQSDENMWPEAYWDSWTQYYGNTEVGFDSIVGPDVRYDQEYFGGHTASSFPPWLAFVRAYGIPGTYASLEPWTFSGVRIHQPNPEAADNWSTEIWQAGKYKGVCYGLSLAMMAAFQDPERFDAKWLPGGGSRELARLSVSTPGVRDVAHALFIYQAGRLQRSERQLNKSTTTPRDVVDRLKEMFERDDRDRDRFLILESYMDEYDESGDQQFGSHAVVPLGMTNLDETTYEIAIYDPNFGGPGAQAIYVDLTDNSWTHSDSRWIGDTGKGLYLSTEAIRAFEPASSMWPHVFEDGPLGERISRADESEESLSIRIAGRAGAVASGVGELRFENGVLTTTLPGGFVSFPITGRPSQPKEYVVPVGGAYHVEAVPRADGIAAVRISGGAVSSTLRLTEADPPTRVVVDVLAEGMEVVSSGPGKFELTARRLVDSGEFRSLRLAGLAATNAAGLRLTADGQGFQILGTAVASTYHFEISVSGSDGHRVFHHINVPLAAKASHRIQPVWRTLGDVPISIAVDHNNDGTVDETMIMENQAPSLALWPGWTGRADRLRLEIRISQAGVPEFRVAALPTLKFQVEMSLLDATHWQNAGTVLGGEWLAISGLPGVLPDTAGPVLIRVRQ